MLAITTICALLLLLVVMNAVLADDEKQPLRTSCNTDDNEVLFMGKCWCEPGWAPPDCKKPILTNGDCDCYPDKPNDRSFLKNVTWTHPKGYRCEALCKWNKDVGVARAPYTEWKDNQVWRQLSFYQKDLPKTVKHNGTHLKARLDEFNEGFKGFTYLKGADFGDVIELGCGGYTQLRNVLERQPIKVKSVTLVDPQINVYKNIEGCSYASGQLQAMGKTYPTTLHSKCTEDIPEVLVTEGFDTVIHMNVLVYARDAFKYLTTMYRILKPGGLLLFHDRWFPDPVTSSRCKTAGFDINIIQVSRTLLDHFLSFFEREPFYSEEQTQYQVSRSKDWCQWRDDEIGYWTVLRKKKNGPKFDQ